MGDITVIDFCKFKISKINNIYADLRKKLKAVQHNIYDTNIQKAVLEKEEFQLKQQIEKIEEFIAKDIENGKKL